METAKTTVGISQEKADLLHQLWLARLNKGEKPSKKGMVEAAIDLLAKKERNFESA